MPVDERTEDRPTTTYFYRCDRCNQVIGDIGDSPHPYVDLREYVERNAVAYRADIAFIDFVWRTRDLSGGRQLTILMCGTCAEAFERWASPLHMSEPLIDWNRFTLDEARALTRLLRKGNLRKEKP